MSTRPSDGPSPWDVLPDPDHAGGSPPPPAPRVPTRLWVAIGVVAVLVALAAVAVVTRDDGGDDAATGGLAGETVGGAAATPTTLPSNVGTTAPTTEGSSGGGASGADLPPVTIPAEAAPPTTIPGSEPSSIPVDIMSGEQAPQWGTLVVDLEEGGHLDFAVHLRAEQQLSLLSLADDGIETAIEVFAPDGSSEGGWEGGEPGVVNGLEWFPPDESLPATGTYVIRVVHRGGAHDPFALGFFGDP